MALIRSFTHLMGASLEKSRERCDRLGKRPGQLDKEIRRIKTVLANLSTSLALVH